MFIITKPNSKIRLPGHLGMASVRLPISKIEITPKLKASITEIMTLTTLNFQNH